MVRLIFFIFSVAPKMVFCMILGEDSALTLRAATDVERGRLPSRRETRLGGLLVGGYAVQTIGVPNAIVSTLQGAIIFFVLAGEFLARYRLNYERRDG